jgi:hypothetical protein
MKFTTKLVPQEPLPPPPVASITITLDANEAAMLACAMAHTNGGDAVDEYRKRGNYCGLANYVTDRVEGNRTYHNLFSSILKALTGE